MTLEAIKRMFRKPTPLERAARELGNLEHDHLEITAEITWAQYRQSYNKDRQKFLRAMLQEVPK